MQQQQTVMMARGATGSRRQVERWFYISTSLCMILLSVVAFGPSILDPSGRVGPLTSLLIAHGIVSSAWLLLFLTQATLVATGRTAVHRRLGILGVVLAVLLVVLGYFTALEAGRRGFELSGDVARPRTDGASAPSDGVGLLTFTLIPFVMFGVLVAAALCFRHRPDIHKRLMLLAVLNPLASAPIGHFVGHWVSQDDSVWILLVSVASTVFLCASAVYDRLSEGRIHPVSLWAPLVLFVCQFVLTPALLGSTTWHEFAAGLIR